MQRGSGAGTQTAFVYSAEPHALAGKSSSGRQKYRKPQHRLPQKSSAGSEEEDFYDAGNNIMFDRRVIRGNTHAAHVVTQSAQREAARLQAEQHRMMRQEAQRRRQEEEARRIPRTPPPVEGRAHMEIQTEEYLEELKDGPEEVEAETQTDALMDRPPSPLFVPTKTGIDAETQVDVGVLFDFDAEVEPILEVLVGKTLELSVLEVLEEEELAAIELRQDQFNEMRDAELAEVQRLESEARRKSAEKLRRLKQGQEHRKAREQLEQKVAARGFARSYLSTVNSEVFWELQQEGHFFDPLRREVSEVFLPWLEGEIVEALRQTSIAMQVANAIMSNAGDLAIKVQTEAEEGKQRERERLAAEAAEKAAAEEAARQAEEERKLAEEAAAAEAEAAENEEAENADE
jgi:hypothetical protein